MIRKFTRKRHLGKQKKKENTASLGEFFFFHRPALRIESEIEFTPNPFYSYTEEI